MPHIVEKLSTRATTFLLTSLQSKVFTRSYGPPKVRKSQFWDSQPGSFKTKRHLGAGFTAMHRKYYKGEGGGFPKVWGVGIL
jgi:hypothetical protein